MRPTNDQSATARKAAITAKHYHQSHRASLIYGQLNKTVPQLVSDFLIEMDAKNQAYYFILENGHFDAFKAYCQKERRRG
jgi:uncharacterized protein (UPF0548 family)